MALVDLKSDLTWYIRPPAVDYQRDDSTGNTGAPVQGFVVNQQETGYLGVNKTTYATYKYSERQQREWKTLRDDPNNVYQSYIDQPLILRGMQRPGELNSKPQRIGWRFDDGLIRGGAVGAVEAAAIDTVRITKWLASPRGLLWIVKQAGLGLTNPKVETLGGPLTRQTRIHTGLPVLLSVAGTAFGLHFTRHGIPFANELASYGNVQIAKQLAPTLYKNRLVALTDNLFSSSIQTKSLITDKKEIKRKTIVFKGAPISELTGLAGPNSVYGIGATTIRRVVDTQSDAAARAEKYNVLTQFAFNQLYAGSISKASIKNISDKVNNTIDKIDSEDFPGLKIQLKLKTGIKSDSDSNNPTTEQKKYTPGHVTDNANSDGGLAWPANTDSTAYITLPYYAIPKRTKGSSAINDFRKSIKDNKQDASDTEKSILGTGAQRDNYYGQNDLEGAYGFGELGKPGANRSNTGRIIIPSSDFGKNDRNVLASNNQFRGDRVTALDINTKDIVKLDEIYPNGKGDLIQFFFEDVVEGKRVMTFRCTITGLSDSFSPSWDRIDIMGRPEGAYMYTSFDRSIQFSFNVMALSRSEMIPMWRKLNYLASYTMPEYDKQTSGRAGGAIMRITIGDMFKRTPGFIESLSYTVPDEMSWDIADDVKDEKDAKQLPMGMEVSMTFKIIGNTRPQLQGTVYDGLNTKTSAWLSDSLTYTKQ